MPKQMYRLFQQDSQRVRVPRAVLALLRQRFASVNSHRRVPAELRRLPFVYAIFPSGDPRKPWEVCVVRRKDGLPLVYPRPIQFRARWHSGKHKSRPNKQQPCGLNIGVSTGPAPVETAAADSTMMPSGGAGCTA